MTARTFILSLILITYGLMLQFQLQQRRIDQAKIEFEKAYQESSRTAIENWIKLNEGH